MSAPRRIVTGHDASGKSVVLSDTPSPKTTDIGTAAFHEIWVTEGMPVQIPRHRARVDRSSDPGAAAARRRDDPLHRDGAGAASPMHRTETLDVGIVLEGETWLLLDDGSETLVGPGDAVVQRGTNHAWENRSDRPVRMRVRAGRRDDHRRAAGDHRAARVLRPGRRLDGTIDAPA